MLKRTIVALLLVPLLFLVTLWAPKIVLTVFVGAFSAIAVNELLYNTKLVRHPRMLLYTMVMAFLMPLWCHYGCPYSAALVAMLLFYMALFAELMLAHTKIPFSQAALCMAAGVIIPYLFSALTRIMIMDTGRYFIMLPFVVAFASDAGAYFAGVTLGKHKLCSIISPKKTVEGLIGGLLLAAVCTVIYGLILQFGFGFKVNYFFVVIYGLIGSLGGVFGDLSFSVIKRQTNIKDYGYLIPGHGGILDRFDSVIVVAPLIEALLLLLPMAVK
jgi:phosphatidate cytidylyltransferase